VNKGRTVNLLGCGSFYGFKQANNIPQKQTNNAPFNS